MSGAYGAPNVCRICGQPNHIAEVCPRMFARQTSAPMPMGYGYSPTSTSTGAGPTPQYTQALGGGSGGSGNYMMGPPSPSHSMYTASQPAGAASPFAPVVAASPDAFSPPAQQVLFRQPPEFYLHKDALRQQQISQHQLTLQQQQQVDPGQSSLPLSGQASQVQAQSARSPQSDAADGCCLFVCLAGVCAGLYAFLKCS